jgi:hypothetical protein
MSIAGALPQTPRFSEALGVSSELSRVIGAQANRRRAGETETGSAEEQPVKG